MLTWKWLVFMNSANYEIIGLDVRLIIRRAY